MTPEEFATEVAERTGHNADGSIIHYRVMVDDILNPPRFRKGEYGAAVKHYGKGDKYFVQLHLGFFFHKDIFDRKKIVRYTRDFLFYENEVERVDES